MAADGRGPAIVGLCRRGQARPRVLWRLDPLLDRALLPGCAPIEAVAASCAARSAPVEALTASSCIHGIPRPSLVLRPSTIANPFSYTHHTVVTPRSRKQTQGLSAMSSAAEILGEERDGCLSCFPRTWRLGWLGFCQSSTPYTEVVNPQDSRKGQVVAPTPAKIATTKLRDTIEILFEVLLVGGGRLGCELLKDLSLFGLKNLLFIDMDTIDVSNIKIQFLFISGLYSCAVRSLPFLTSCGRRIGFMHYSGINLFCFIHEKIWLASEINISILFTCCFLMLISQSVRPKEDRRKLNKSRI